MTRSAGGDQVSAVPAQQSLDEADALVEAGRFRAAIDLLTELNRSTPSTEVELRLLAVRHRAGLERAGADRAAPRLGAAPSDDLVAGEWPPTVEARDLTPLVLNAAIHTRGALLVRSLASSEYAQQLIDDIDRAFDAYDARAAGDQSRAPSPWYEPFAPCPLEIQVNRPWLRQGGGLLAGDSPRTFFDLLETFEAVGLVDVLTAALGERPLVSLDKSSLRRVTQGGGIEWHQDGAFLGRETRAVNVWLALNGAGRDAPGLDVVPRRVDHIVETGVGGATYDWSIGPDVVGELCGTSSFARPVFEPGDALLFDGLLVHRTSDDPAMLGVRYAVETWFFAASTYPEQQRVPLAV